MTYGQIRNRVALEVGQINLSLLDGYLFDRYVSILDKLKWQRRAAQTTFETTAPYATGTIALTQGSNAIVGTGTVWTTQMSGRVFRVDGENEGYVFTYVSGTSGTLDRNYDGSSNAAATYQIIQAVYPLPADCRIFNDATLLDTEQPLVVLSRSELNQTAPSRTAVGVPQLCAAAVDSTANPPTLQIELYPAPDAVYSVFVPYTAEAPAISGTGTAMLPWLRPSALVAGAAADALEHLEKFNRADRQKAKYVEFVGDMIRTEGLNRGSVPIKLAGWLTRHNLDRALNSGPRTGPRLP